MALSYNLPMEKVRLGGMALENGVLVQGPTAWACAVRLPNGELRVAAQKKRFQASHIRSPLLRGPARLAEAFSVLPGIRRALPEARLPFQRPRVRAAFLASSLAVRLLRSSPRAGSVGNELSSVALAILPAAVSMRGTELTAYHGAEHATIGTYEHDEPRGRVHERCGSNLIAPLLAGSIVVNVLASRLPWRYRGAARIGGNREVGNEILLDQIAAHAGGVAPAAQGQRTFLVTAPGLGRGLAVAEEDEAVHEAKLSRLHRLS